MRRLRTLTAPAAALLLAAVAGCGVGAGEENEGEAELRVTRDYGAQVLIEATVADPPETETVMRALDAEAGVETRFGGRFVQSIDGLEGGVDDGRSFDWFFYVDGIESSVGAADVPVWPGREIWWDYRDWTDVMRVPAVVGSFPEPFTHTEAEDAVTVRVECVRVEEACAAAGERLAEAGVDFTNERFLAKDGEAYMRVLVGLWEDIRADRTALLLEGGPHESGVFGRPVRVNGSWRLDLLDTSAATTGRERHGGLVAALRAGEDPPVWVVTGMDSRGLDAAVAALEEETLRDRYAVAVAVAAGGAVALPAEGPE